MKKLIILFLFISINLNSQTNFPKDYFSNPLEIELILNGNFGESRPSHFHSGIDIKTQFKEGLNVFSSAEGYVSRISIKHGGFGKALYINHPNGYTTVYAHLKKFNKKIEDYIKKIQYNKKSYQIEHYLKKDIIRILKNENIGSSGNTGSSFGPHLHYETRLTKNQKAINPQLFGIDIKDSRRPIINSVFLYKLDSLNKISEPIKLKINKINDSIYQSEKVTANGTIGFGVNGFDRQDLANNKNWIYKYSTVYDNKKNIEFNFNSFFFEESIKIKTLIDYKYYIQNKSYDFLLEVRLWEYIYINKDLK
jgi:murein DD-endopeptidase MepM/ murein hydrolase activator NlpD